MTQKPGEPTRHSELLQAKNLDGRSRVRPSAKRYATWRIWSDTIDSMGKDWLKRTVEIAILRKGVVNLVDAGLVSDGALMRCS